ncbi:urease accessory protein UreE [Hydrococcus rivularis NIES-593]|uniref:Urease accessory protein UreE n=1 Tax=Hydrococcus rivularis NIES-593 TaxID=1921803 RepID=A0A1U7HGV5_9CYAN|nr:urease accessory protein UreE [Hydrococcus rivularis]OKH22810.1 urease accessory protein UreE [Hydrococcus rivularis NIES-593]
MLTFTERLSEVIDRSIIPQPVIPLFTLSLSAEERTRSRHRFETPDGQSLFLRLPRGTILQDGDLLKAETGEIIKIAAKPEPVLTVTAQNPLDLLRAAYHLGNRHVPLEVAPNYLRLSPDPVLKDMLERMGVTAIEEIVPFQPEIGAYHAHS